MICSLCLLKVRWKSAPGHLTSCRIPGKVCIIVADLLHDPPAELVRPSYNIYRYTDQIYKIVHFKLSMPSYRGSGDVQHHEEKMDSSISRAKRVVLELALCNDWKYFCTFTIDSAKYDRKELKTWAEKFTQWIRDQRKKYGLSFDYVLVPEQHADGSWHMHGLFDDSPTLISFRELFDQGENIPWKLVKGGYFNWPDYQKKFGFCSFGNIRSKVGVSFYITKYISKSIGESCIPVGMKLYLNSQNLNRASFHGDVYGECSYLNSFLENHYEFCDTGFTHIKHNCKWDFAFEYLDYSVMDVFSHDQLEEKYVEEFETYFEGVQSVLDGF